MTGTVLVWHRRIPRGGGAYWWQLTYLDGGSIASVKRRNGEWTGHILAPNLTLESYILPDSAKSSVEEWLDGKSGDYTFLTWDDTDAE